MWNNYKETDTQSLRDGYTQTENRYTQTEIQTNRQVQIQLRQRDRPTMYVLSVRHNNTQTERHLHNNAPKQRYIYTKTKRRIQADRYILETKRETHTGRVTDIFRKRQVVIHTDRQRYSTHSHTDRQVQTERLVQAERPRTDR